MDRYMDPILELLFRDKEIKQDLFCYISNVMEILKARDKIKDIFKMYRLLKNFPASDIKCAHSCLFLGYCVLNSVQSTSSRSRAITVDMAMVVKITASLVFHFFRGTGWKLS